MISPGTAEVANVTPEAEDENLIRKDFLDWCDEDIEQQVRFPDCWNYN